MDYGQPYVDAMWPRWQQPVANSGPATNPALSPPPTPRAPPFLSCPVPARCPAYPQPRNTVQRGTLRRCKSPGGGGCPVLPLPGGAGRVRHPRPSPRSGWGAPSTLFYSCVWNRTLHRRYDLAIFISTIHHNHAQKSSDVFIYKVNCT